MLIHSFTIAGVPAANASAGKVMVRVGVLRSNGCCSNWCHTFSIKTVFVSLVILFSTAQQALAQLAVKAQEVWPSLDAYYQFNQKFRLYGTVSATKLEESSFSDGALGVFLDYFTFPLAKKMRSKPVFLKEQANRAENLPGKFLWLRAGYQYSATPPSAKDPFKESMIVTEGNARFYMPYSVLLTWKNRFDWRINNGEFKTRYRPRLQLERDMRTEFLFFTAYGFIEYFANFGNSAVNRFRTQLGVELKVMKNINYEVFWNHQVASQPEVQEVDAFGMTLKLYMSKKVFDDLKIRKSKKSPEKQS